MHDPVILVGFLLTWALFCFLQLPIFPFQISHTQTRAHRLSLSLARTHASLFFSFVRNQDLECYDIIITMAISSSIPNLLKQRKYPFIFAFFLLLICVTLLLISNSQSPISTTADLSQPDPYSSKPVPQPSTHSPENTAPSNNTNATADTRKDTTDSGTESGGSGDDGDEMVAVEWKVCDGSVAVDYIPCLDNRKAIMALRSRRHMEHRERHCPDPCPRCLVPLPQGYKIPVPWPKSRDMVR